jgi:hypothetical protein
MSIASELDMASALPEQLFSAPSNTTHLTVENVRPYPDDWMLLSDHFTSVTHLEMDSGFQEMFADGDIPLHWPLEKITISSACGDTCQSPWILKGKVRHLVLFYTAGLRFEGPTSDELLKAHWDAVDKGEKEAPNTISGIRIIFMSDLVTDWMREKDTRQDDVSDADTINQLQINLRILEIVHNDMHDTFCCYVQACPALISSVETLSLVGIDLLCSDLGHSPQDILSQVLPQLTSLKYLVLILGDRYADREQLPNLVHSLPPNLEVLRFRSSVSLAETKALFDAKWVSSFADPSFLPHLQTLSFVLDLESGENLRRKNEVWTAQYNARMESGKDSEDESGKDSEDESGE